MLLVLSDTVRTFASVELACVVSLAFLKALIFALVQEPQFENHWFSHSLDMGIREVPVKSCLDFKIYLLEV